MKYYILMSALIAPTVQATQSPTRKCCMPSPMAFRKKTAELPKYETISQQLGKSVQRINPALNADLFEAVRTNNTEAIRQLLNSSKAEIPDVNARNAMGYTPLDLALERSQDIEIVRLLIDAGTNVNATSRGWTSLERAIHSHANTEIIKLLIDAGANVNTKDRDDGTTPLMQASRINRPQIVRLLLNTGADINAKDNADKTAFDHAEHSKEITNILREYKNLQNPAAQTATQKAMESYMSSLGQKSLGARDVSGIVHGFVRPTPKVAISPEIESKTRQIQEQERLYQIAQQQLEEDLRNLAVLNTKINTPLTNLQKIYKNRVLLLRNSAPEPIKKEFIHLYKEISEKTTGAPSSKWFQKLDFPSEDWESFFNNGLSATYSSLMAIGDWESFNERLRDVYPR